MKQFLILVFFVLIVGLGIFFSIATDKNEPTLNSKTSNVEGDVFLVAMTRNEDSKQYQFMKKYYDELFGRLNIKMKMKYLPHARASIETDSGRFDAEARRIYSYSESHKKMIRVEEPVDFVYINAYTNISSKIKLEGWDSLKNSNYKVEYVRGIKVTHEHLTKVIPKENLNAITSATQGLERLAKNRIDVYVEDEMVAEPLLDELGLRDKIIKAGNLHMMKVYLHVYMKHSKLVPLFEEAIRAMKAEGLVEKYRREVWGSVSSNVKKF